MISLVIAVLIWGASFALAKTALFFATPYELVTIRLFLGAIFVGIVSFRKLNVATFFSRRALLLGLFEFGGTYLLYTLSLSYLDSGFVGTLTLLTPVFTFLVALSFGVQKFSTKAMIACVASFVGAYFCVGSHAIGAPANLVVGIILIMLSNFSFALGNVLITKWNFSQSVASGAETQPSTVALTAAGLMWGGLLAFIVSFFMGPTILNLRYTSQSLFLFAYLGLIATGLGFFLWNRGVAKTSAFSASLIGNFKAPIAVICGTLLLHENFSWSFWLGLALLFVAAILVPPKGTSDL